MKFAYAYEALKNGAKIKRAHWLGWWSKENGTIKMHCKDGRVLDIRETEDVFFTIDNLITEDWEIIEGYLPDLCVSTFTFGEALRRMKQGKRVARKGWSGKGQYVFLADNLEFHTDADISEFADTGVHVWDALAFRGNSGIQVGWLASQADMLGEDWYEVM